MIEVVKVSVQYYVEIFLIRSANALLEISNENISALVECLCLGTSW